MCLYGLLSVYKCNSFIISKFLKNSIIARKSNPFILFYLSFYNPLYALICIALQYVSAVLNSGGGEGDFLSPKDVELINGLDAQFYPRNSTVSPCSSRNPFQRQMSKFNTV